MTVTYRGHRSHTCDNEDRTAADLPNASADHTQPTRGSLFGIPLELRWGVNGGNLRAIWLLHEQVLDTCYTTSHYESLLGNSWLSLIAYTSREAYDAVMSNVASAAPTLSSSDSSTKQTTDAAAGSCSSTSDASAGAADGGSTRTVSGASSLLSRLRLSLADTIATDTADVSRIHAIDEMIMQAERRAGVTSGELNMHHGHAVLPPSAAADRDGCRRVNGEAASLEAGAAERDTRKQPSTAAPCDVVIGFAIGALGYAGYGAADLLCVNPTGYVGFVGVAPAFQSCGIGSALMQHLLHYMTHDLPIHANAYLHYNEAGMRRLVCGTSRSDSSTNGSRRNGPSESDAPIARIDAGDASSSSSSSCQKTQSAACDTDEVSAASAASTSAADKDDEENSGAASACADDDAVDVNPIIQYGVREVWLHCLHDRPALLNFYRRLHFREVRELRDFYFFKNSVHDAYFLLYTKPPSETTASAPSDRAARDVSDSASSRSNSDRTPPNRATHEDDFVQTLLQRDQERQHRQEARQAALKRAQGGDGGVREVATSAKEGGVDGEPEGAHEEEAKPLVTGDAAASRRRASVATTRVTKVRLRPQWLVPGRYAEVWDVHCVSAETMREKWKEQVAPKLVDLTDHSKDGYVTRTMAYLAKNGMEIVYCLNALAAVCLICYSVIFGMPSF